MEETEMQKSKTANARSQFVKVTDHVTSIKDILQKKNPK
jgi:hypothetical protein